jgi:acetylornithine deacetylase/succinyl-diaminopimelate desuccinylase-like protein
MPADPVTQISALSTHESIRKGLAFLESDASRTLDEQKAMALIPAPPFKEAARAAYFRECLADAGVGDVRIDAEGNVIGVRRGSGGPTLVLSAHIDTVFPQDTDLTITEKDGKLIAPGIRDDSRGLAVVLSIARAFAETGVRTVGDVWFVGTVGEEALGNLRGVRALFREHSGIDGFVSVDGGDMGRITLGATGSQRFRVTYKGPGGHSFGAFGVPSAVHAMGRAIAKIADLSVQTEPKTTFNVGRVRGGTGATAIAEEAVMDVDLRSNAAGELEKITQAALAIIEQSARDENARWASNELTVSVQDLGKRPAGSQSTEIAIVRAAVAALGALGIERIQYGSSSTDCNIPISLGIPAIAIPGGGKSGGNHSLTEWFDPRMGHLGPQAAFLTTLVLAGVDGFSEPVLERRAARI